MPTFFGLKISRDRKPDFRWLTSLNIRTVIDVGASKGKAVKNLRALFPDAHIHAFEPLKDVFLQMQERLVNDKNITLHNIALGTTQESITMNRSSYSGSSSVLKMNALHKQLWPITAGERPEQVNVNRLDSLLDISKLKKNILVVIDVQGMEDKVVVGGSEILGETSVIIVETSFVELYKGQPLFADMHSQLQNLGFRYFGAWAPELKSPRDGMNLQQDSIFIRDTT